MAHIINPKSDGEIQLDVLRELGWDTRVEEAEIGVQVRSGVVVLTGTVGAWAKKLAAQEAAHRVKGVLDVVNDLEVVVPGAGAKSDVQIALAVRRALEWDVYVPHEAITSTVAGGVVTLEGTVETFGDREDAHRAVRYLDGVRAVVNRIEVRPGQVATEKVRAAIEEALGRRADREADRIQLRVEGDHVSVTGVVGSWGERLAVLGAARGTIGVRVVEDHLRVQSHGA